MTEVAHDLEKLADAIERERGRLDLLGLVKREGRTEWELVFAAPWVSDHLLGAIEYVSKKAAKVLDAEEAASISSVLPLQQASSILAAKFRTPGEYENFTLNGIPVERAIIVRLKRPAARTRRGRRHV